MGAGYIYVLTNPSFPAYVKIGYADDVEARLKELNRSECLPFAFRLHCTLEVPKRLADKDVHALIGKMHPGLRAVETFDGKPCAREFFRLSPEEACGALLSLAAVKGALGRLKFYAPDSGCAADEEEVLLAEASAEVLAAWKELKRRVMELDGVQIAFSCGRALFEAGGRTFLACEPQAKRLTCYLGVPAGNLDDPAGMAGLLLGASPCGVGDYLVLVQDAAGAKALMPLVRQAFGGQGKGVAKGCVEGSGAQAAMEPASPAFPAEAPAAALFARLEEGVRAFGGVRIEPLSAEVFFSADGKLFLSVDRFEHETLRLYLCMKKPDLDDPAGLAVDASDEHAPGACRIDASSEAQVDATLALVRQSYEAAKARRKSFRPLTDFLPRLQGADFGTWVHRPSHMPFVSYAAIADELRHAIAAFVKERRDLGLNDYLGVLEQAGVDLGCDDVASLDGQTVAALAVCALRADRFCEGAYLGCLEDGRMATWLARLKEIDDAEAGSSGGGQASGTDGAAAEGTADRGRPAVEHFGKDARRAASAACRDASELESLMETLLLGLAVGDALGVPFEFMQRGTFEAKPLQGGGSHGQPAGTWSDDTALALAFADALLPGGFDAEQAGRNFQDWLYKGKFTARGKVFDVGGATQAAIGRMRHGAAPEQAGGKGEYDNGNGSLMRIAPVAAALLDVKDPAARYEAVRRASSLTHAHPLACTCCFVFEEYLRLLSLGWGRDAGYRRLCGGFADSFPFIDGGVLAKLGRVLDGGLAEVPEPAIQSGGFVVHTLEAALWCLLNSESYAETVLKAASLGRDADTTACVAGAAAALCWGRDSIPEEWVEGLAGRDELLRIARKAAAQIKAGEQAG